MILDMDACLCRAASVRLRRGTESLCQACERFSELLGVSFIDHGVQEEFGLRAMVSQDWTVELTAPIGSNSALTSYFESWGGGTFGFGVRVKDIEDARTDATAKGDL